MCDHYRIIIGRCLLDKLFLILWRLTLIQLFISETYTHNGFTLFTYLFINFTLSQTICICVREFDGFHSYFQDFVILCTFITKEGLKFPLLCEHEIFHRCKFLSIVPSVISHIIQIKQHWMSHKNISSIIWILNSIWQLIWPTLVSKLK